MTLPKDQRDLLRRLRATVDDSYRQLGHDDRAALLDFCANLGGAKDRAEFFWKHAFDLLGRPEIYCTACVEAKEADPRHAWDDARWVEEWKKREMEG